MYAWVEIDNKRCLVFGLSWRTHIGAKADKTAKKAAASNRASHYVFSVDTQRVSETLGSIRIRGKQGRLPKGSTGYSAAQAFARINPLGIVATTARMPDGTYWFVAARRGNVITSTDIVGSADEVREALQTMRDRHGDDLRVIADIENAAPVNAENLASELNDQTILRPVGLTIETIPRPVKVAIGGALGFVLLQEGNALWAQYQDSKRLEALRAAQVDPNVAWTQALTQFTRRTLVTGPEALSVLVDHLQTIPTRVERWDLTQVECSASSQWSCVAQYERAHLGTTEGFEKDRPAEWKMAWQPLDKATAHFSVKAPFRPLGEVPLPTVADVERGTVTQLQRIRPAFGGISTTVPTAATIPAPTNENGSPIPPPSSMGSLKKIGVTFAGPFRSVLAIDNETSSQIAWENVTMKMMVQVQPGIRASRMAAQLRGTIYAR